MVMVTMERERLSLVMATMAMLQATIIEAHKVFMDIMVTMERDLPMLDTMVVPAPMFTRAVPTTMDLMAMASTIMARDLLMLDTMEVPAPMFTRAVPITTDLMAMASTIMAKDPPMLVTMAMDIMVMVVAASNMLTGPTLLMESMLLTPTR